MSKTLEDQQIKMDIQMDQAEMQNKYRALE